MQRRKDIDTRVSGTTAISAYIRGKQKQLFISNVGDSRAIQGTIERGQNVAKPLSWDQTPYRGSERRRIRQSGARILSRDQIDGKAPIAMIESEKIQGTEEIHDYRDLIEGEDEESDLRVWHRNEESPGTTYTRSLGDSEAEKLGVVADPEMIMLNLEKVEKDVIVLASDGVFEFLTNQGVIDICEKHKNDKHGALKACKAVISQSQDFWRQYENVVDDMTMICIFIES